MWSLHFLRWSIFRDGIQSWGEEYIMLLLLILRLRRGLINLLCCPFEDYDTRFALIHRLIWLRMHGLPKGLSFVIFELRLAEFDWSIFTWHSHHKVSLLGFNREISHSVRLMFTNNNWIVIFTWCIEVVLIRYTGISNGIVPNVLASRTLHIGVLINFWVSAEPLSYMVGIRNNYFFHFHRHNSTWSQIIVLVWAVTN